jgi:putative aldouronate transport system permease protein
MVELGKVVDTTSTNESEGISTPLARKKQKSFLTKIAQKYFGRTVGDVVFNTVLYLAFTLLLFICIYPFAYVLIKSLTVVDTSDPYHPVNTIALDAYATIVKETGIFRSFLLSVGVVFVFTVISVFITVLTAYPLSRKGLSGRKIFIFYILFCVLFSGGLIPYYILIKDLQLRNTVLVYVITGLLSPYNIIIVKNFISGIPEEIFESAKIDGAGEIRTLLRIVFPLSGPIVATISLWEAVGKWNNWMTGVLYVTDKSKWMIQQYLREILITASNQSGTVDPEIMALSENIKMAAIVISILPIIIAYPFVQKYFVKGTLLGSVKG